jgi:hypothetical protein
VVPLSLFFIALVLISGLLPHFEVYPNESMVGAVDEFKFRLVSGGPENSAAGDFQVFARQDVIDSQVADVFVTEVAGVEGGIAFVFGVHLSLLLSLLNSASALGLWILNKRMFE